MNETDPIQHDTNVNYPISILFSSVSGICCLVNVSFLVVCFKALQKTLHHLLILTLCFSDAILSTSSVLLLLSPMVHLLRTNIIACVGQVFLIFYGILLNYTILFLLCLQRYLLLRTYNFGSMFRRLESCKHRIVIGAVLFTFAYQLLDSALVPMEDEIFSCSAPNLYGRYLSVFTGLNIIPVSVLMVMLVTFYLLASLKIWKTFFKSTVHPKTENGKNAPQSSKQVNVNMFSNISKSELNQSQRVVDVAWSKRRDFASKISVGFSQSESSRDQIEVVNYYDGGLGYDQLSVNTDISATKNIIIELDGPDDLQPQQSTPPNQGLDTKIGDVNSKKEGKEEITKIVEEESCDGNLSRRGSKKSLKQKWELKVFVTCVILALQTMILTLPIIIGFWYDVVSKSALGLQTKYILGIFYILNSLSNPFIYAWRIPEIKEEFKKLFRRQS